MNRAHITTDWLDIVQAEFDKPHMQKLRTFLMAQKRSGKTILPPNDEVFAALNATPFAQTKVVILGQDPYHGLGQGHGLAFSVRPEVPIPPSLQNIYKELATDLCVTPPQNGFLQHWAEQGVLLLNSVLTVNHNQAASHRNQGWEQFTDMIITYLSNHKQHLVYILWGAFAHKKRGLIDAKKHLVLTASHPSPLSAHAGFFGSKPFSKTNYFLTQQGISPIHWTR